MKLNHQQFLPTDQYFCFLLLVVNCWLHFLLTLMEKPFFSNDPHQSHVVNLFDLVYFYYHNWIQYQVVQVLRSNNFFADLDSMVALIFIIFKFRFFWWLFWAYTLFITFIEIIWNIFTLNTLRKLIFFLVSADVEEELASICNYTFYSI